MYIKYIVIKWDTKNRNRLIMILTIIARGKVPVITVVVISIAKVKRIKWIECIADLIACSRRPRLEPTKCTRQHYISTVMIMTAKPETK